MIARTISRMPSAVVTRNGADLAKLAGEIGWYEDQARKTVMLALQYKFEIGRRLARAKSLLPHGQFLSWARQEFGWSARHVQRHLTLAENAARVSCLPPGASLRMALAAIRKLRVEPKKLPGEAARVDPSQRVHIVGELEEGTIDRDCLLNLVARLSKELGAPNVRWRIR